MDSTPAPGSRTAAATDARRRYAQDALGRVRGAIKQIKREKAQPSVAAVARRAGVSRSFIYDNPEARAAVSAALAEAGERRVQLLSEADDPRESTWRERALNAEDALKTAYAEITAQRPASAPSSARSATSKPSGPRTPSPGSPPRTPPSSSASASSRPRTAPSKNGSRQPGRTTGSPTAGSRSWKPRSPARPRSHVMPSMPLDVGDAIELAELLQFLGNWLESDRGNLAASLARFVGTPPTAPTRCARTSPGSGSSSASPTARACSPPTSRERPPPQPSAARTSLTARGKLSAV